jgi:hypothetical protein
MNEQGSSLSDGGGGVTRCIWLLAGLCLVATACAQKNPAPPPVRVEPVPVAARLAREEEPDGMIPIVSVQPSTDASSGSTAAPAGLTAAVTIKQSSSPAPAAPTTEATAAPKVATAVPKAITAVPKTATSVPPSIPGCSFSQELSEGDGILRALQSPPAVFYGAGLCAGDKVEAFVAGKSCATATVNAAGQWSISIHPSAACGPTEGAAVTLTVNGKTATVSPPVQWKSGGLPPDVANGYALTR